MGQLGQLEAAVMDRMWDADRALFVRDVLGHLQRERELAYTTVMTVMDNLFRKGYLRRERDGRAYRYTAAQSREEHSADMMEAVLAGGGDRTATLMHFIDHIDPTELAALEQVLANRRTGGQE